MIRIVSALVAILTLSSNLVAAPDRMARVERGLRPAVVIEGDRVLGRHNWMKSSGCRVTSTSPSRLPALDPLSKAALGTPCLFSIELG